MKTKILLFQQLQMSRTLDASRTQNHTHAVSFHKQDILSLFCHRSRVLDLLMTLTLLPELKHAGVWPCLLDAGSRSQSFHFHYTPM